MKGKKFISLILSAAMVVGALGIMSGCDDGSGRSTRHNRDDSEETEKEEIEESEETEETSETTEEVTSASKEKETEETTAPEVSETTSAGLSGLDIDSGVYDDCALLYEPVISECREILSYDDMDLRLDACDNSQYFVEMSVPYDILTDVETATADTVGYAFYDFDGNGVYELVIGNVTDDENDFYYGAVYAVYTIEEDAIVQVFYGWFRNMYYMLNDGTLFNMGSSGVEYSSATVYSIDGSELLVEQNYFHQPDGWHHNMNGDWWSLDWDHSSATGTVYDMSGESYEVEVPFNRDGTESVTDEEADAFVSDADDRIDSLIYVPFSV